MLVFCFVGIVKNGPFEVAVKCCSVQDATAGGATPLYLAASAGEVALDYGSLRPDFLSGSFLCCAFANSESLSSSSSAGLGGHAVLSDSLKSRACVRPISRTAGAGGWSCGGAHCRWRQEGATAGCAACFSATLDFLSTFLLLFLR